jgi:hypothetical protein
MRTLGDALAPRSVPVGLVTLQRGCAAYQTLYTTLGPDGKPRDAVYGGSWGMLVAAGRR